MDCKRLSIKEVENEKYVGVHREIAQLKDQGKDVCRKSCITSGDCEAWEYTSDGDCKQITELYMKTPIEKPGSYSGIMECRSDVDVIIVLWWLVMIVITLIVIWFIINSMKE